MDYLPPVLAEVRDYQALMQAEQAEIDRLWAAAERLLENQFIDGTDETGIARYELMMDIQPKATDDLALRQFRVLSRYNEQLPYTYRKMLEQLKSLCGENGVKAAINGLTIEIKVELTAKEKVNEVRELLERMLPANVLVTVSLLYNQWGSVKHLTWEQAKIKTWGQLRNEVL